MNRASEDDRTKDNRNALDQRFKTIIHRPSILAWILRSCIDEFKDMDIEEIKSGLDLGAEGTQVIGKETEQFSDENGAVIMDNVFEVRIADEEPITVIVEIEGQNHPGPGYPLGKRAAYYLSRLVSQQRGNVFKGKDYGSMRRTYSIWIMMDPLRGNRKSMIRYRMMPEVIGEPQCVEDIDVLNIIFINLGGDYDRMPDEVRFAATLFSRDLTEEQRRQILQD